VLCSIALRTTHFAQLPICKIKKVRSSNSFDFLNLANPPSRWRSL
jgi:hypothetical protein